MSVKTYNIKTFGCQMNVSDSERIAGFLESHGLKPTKDINSADLVVFNTCGVRQMAEDRVYGQIHNLAKRETRNVKRPLIIVTGCLAHRKDVQRRLRDKVDLFFSINRFDEFENWIIENLLEIGNWKLEIPAQLKTFDCSNYLSLSPKYTNPNQAYVPVMTGCNNFCSYCVVPYARGREVSRPVEDIISEINNLAKNGCKEIALLGQNVNSYKHVPSPQPSPDYGRGSIPSPPYSGEMSCNHDRGGNVVDFPILLNYLAKKFQNIHFKFLTSHPKDFSEELMDVIANNKNIEKEIHLPIQAGSDKILRAMNRPYTKEHYLNLIKKAREKIPDVSFTTDVIVGFPGETEEDFQETASVFKKVKYKEAYINKYSPRPGTAAWRLGDPVSWEEKKRREKVLRKIIQEKNK